MPQPDVYPPERIVAPDPGWSRRFSELSAGLHRDLGDGWQVEHVGSTSVPGLVAKPVVDLALGVPRGLSVSGAGRDLRAAGWTEPVVVGDHQATFLLDGPVRTAIGHLFTADQWATAHVRLFADWLRRHPADRDAYAALKSGLVAAGTWGEGYTRGKATFVLDVVNRARAERALTPVEAL
ncbi:GrpB family protein [Intrasporangium sp. YIM S08009]|uniref:GrpB family protein n=1 Tax=Intrasporangium zincisolvens TaxID=3080018 RepID=UPI002B051A45|nr:GrpB family protein [Intrasporangium sp. YIM S08009]